MKTAFVQSRPSGPTVLYALTALVLAAAAWAYFTPIDISVRASGIVRPEGDPIRIVSEVGGRIRHVHVREGSEVRQGDPLIQLDARDLTLRERSLETRIHLTELRVHDLKRQVDDTTAIEEQSTSLDALDRDAAHRNVQAALESARLRYARSDLLLRDGLIARQLHDEARLALTQAEADESRLSTNSTELKRAQAEAHIRDLAAGETPLRAELAVLYHDLEQTRLELDRLTITSPADGQITSLASLHTAEIISQGTAIANVVPRSRPAVVESWLPAADRAFVRAGQSVRLQTDAFPPDQYNAVNGTVLSISPDARFNESLNGAFRVLIVPAPDSPELHLGMTFQVLFITRTERALGLLFQKIKRNFEE
ncbi:MAG TPA: HlyD family secretion protein [Terriglobia bacterium]|nr:HlyD family secretion protein [Terriglobia bacterium]